MRNTPVSQTAHGTAVRHRSGLTSTHIGRRTDPSCLVSSVYRSTLCPTPVPIALESVHAGFPSVAQDYFAGDFSFDEHVIQHPDTTFIVTVAGDSMQGAGIWDGDLLVVDRSLEPCDGDVVVAILDDELTVKRLVMHGTRPVLHAENPRYPDFSSSDAGQLEIWGVVVGNFHMQRGRHTKSTLRRQSTASYAPSTPSDSIKPHQSDWSAQHPTTISSKQAHITTKTNRKGTVHP